jgi:hypothetical protein
MAEFLNLSVRKAADEYRNSGFYGRRRYSRGYNSCFLWRHRSISQKLCDFSLAPLSYRIRLLPKRRGLIGARRLNAYKVDAHAELLS